MIGVPNMMTVLRSASARVLAIFLYCSGAVFAPALHQAFHQPDHIHLGDSIVPDEDHHEHEAEEHHDDHHREDHDDHDEPRREHGASSLWHFGAALSDHLDRVPAIGATRAVVWTAEEVREDHPRAVRMRTPRLRGPPLPVA